ncbi:MAG: hypothetical protein R3C53_02220 [Pirellulaceae bacterium]
MNDESLNSDVDLELEARIVALVLGEASEVECAELKQLISEHPDLAALQQEFEVVHGLLHHVGHSGMSVANDDWQLSTESAGRYWRPSVLTWNPSLAWGPSN